MLVGHADGFPSAPCDETKPDRQTASHLPCRQMSCWTLVKNKECRVVGKKKKKVRRLFSKRLSVGGLGTTESSTDKCTFFNQQGPFRSRHPASKAKQPIKQNNLAIPYHVSKSDMPYTYVFLDFLRHPKFEVVD